MVSAILVGGATMSTLRTFEEVIAASGPSDVATGLALLAMTVYMIFEGGRGQIAMRAIVFVGGSAILSALIWLTYL